MSDLLFPTDTTGVTPATGDIILIADVSDSNNPKDCTLAELPISTATQTALNTKQDTLVSGTNIKTVNGNSLLGSGDLVVSGGGSVATDAIWDAKGDLAGGTGANTASRLAVGTNGQVLTADSAEATGLKWSNPAGGGDALTSGTLAQFASTTSLELKGVISDETGSGALVFANSPTLVTPVLGAATATSINGATITSGTLNGSVTGTNTGNQTVANTSNATSHTVTLSATGGSVQLVEGSGITLTTTGTSADGIVTIASTGGGSGDVVGPASATDNAVARFDTTTGKLLQNSGVTIGDTNIVSGVATLNTQAINATAQVDFSYDFSDTILSGGGFTFYGATHRRINDGGSNELIKFPTTSVAGAVNEFTISNAATGNGPILEVTGGDASAPMNFQAKGTGPYNFKGTSSGPADIRLFEDTDNGTNYASLIAPASLASNVVLTLPSTTGTLVTGGGTASGTNTGDQTSIVGITGTKAQFDTAVTDGNIAYTDVTTLSSLVSVGTITTGTWNATDIAVADGGTGRSTGTTAYSLIATGTTATGPQQTLANGATTEILVGGGVSALPVWTTAQGSGAPVRATSPTLTTPNIGTPTSGTLTNCTGLPVAGLVSSTSTAIGVGSIELGHATDTTISRVSAGVIAVEGVNVVTTALTGSTTQAGIAEASISSEVNTGTDANRYVSPDSLAGSNFGIRYVAASLNGTTALTTSDKAYFRIPSAFTGMNLVSVSATVGTGASGSSSSGVPTFTVKNVTDGNQMLSTSLTVDASEYTSATAATPAVINASFDDVVTDDLIEVACTVAGTGVTYATILVGFQLP